MVRKAIPMMIVAGFIGVSIVSLFPQDIFYSLEVNVFTVLMVSLVSFLVPVPMFFDTIFS